MSEPESLLETQAMGIVSGLLWQSLWGPGIGIEACRLGDSLVYLVKLRWGDVVKSLK